MTVPQTFFTATLPTTRTDGSPLAVGDIVQLAFTVTDKASGAVSVHTFPVPPAAVPGSAIDAPFAQLTPPFVPVGGHTYDATATDTDKNGVSSNPTNVLEWTEAQAAPNPPTNFTVA